MATTNVIFISHIPDGFFEGAMKKYFSQFGKVFAVRVCRNKKTGKSRGFGYVKFQHAEVAKIAADSTNNYLIFDKILKCEVVPEERIYPTLFAKQNIGRDFRKAIKYNEAENVDEKVIKYLKKQKQHLKELREQLEPLGVQLDIKVPKFRPSALKVNEEEKTD